MKTLSSFMVLIFKRGFLLAYLLFFAFSLTFFASPSLLLAESDNFTPEIKKEIQKLIEENSLFAPLGWQIKANSFQELNQELKTFDPYSDFISQKQIEERKNLQTQLPYSIGMDIIQRDNGDILCVPYPKSPASLAGIRYTDILKKVNGRHVEGLTLEEIGLIIRKDKEQKFFLEIERNGQILEKSVNNTKEFATSLYISYYRGIPRIRILRFGVNTHVELEEALEIYGQNPLLILDLRGNTGGDTKSALKSASLFLAEKAPLLYSKNKEKTFLETNNLTGPYSKKPELILWQDALTASSGEIFTEALVYNKRALSVGQISGGKSSIQTLFPIKGLGYLSITTEEAQYLNSYGKPESWSKKGLKPLQSPSIENHSENIIFLN